MLLGKKIFVFFAISCTCMPIAALHSKVDGRLGEVGAPRVVTTAYHLRDPSPILSPPPTQVIREKCTLRDPLAKGDKAEP